MPKKYRPKIKGYVLPYIYVDNRLLVLVTMEKLKEPGEYYGTLLGGTSKNLREVKESTVRELCEETRGYMQIDKSNLIEYMTINDKDRCTIYLLPLSNGYKLIHEINSFKNGVLMPPECAESSFIIALGVDELLSWTNNTGLSSEPYYYFRKPFVNKYPLTSYKKFLEYFDTGYYGPDSPDVHYRVTDHQDNPFIRDGDSSKSSGSSKSSDRDSDEDNDLRKMDDDDMWVNSRIQDLEELSDLNGSFAFSELTDDGWSIKSEKNQRYKSVSKTIQKPRMKVTGIDKTNCKFRPESRDKIMDDLENRDNYEKPKIPQIWIGERLAHVLHNLDEIFLAQEYSKKAINYNYVDLNLCECLLRGKSVRVPSGPSSVRVPARSTRKGRMPMHSI